MCLISSTGTNDEHGLAEIIGFHDLAHQVHTMVSPQQGLTVARLGGASQSRVVFAKLSPTKSPENAIIILEVNENELNASAFPHLNSLQAMPDGDIRRQFVIQPRFVDVNSRRLLNQLTEDGQAISRLPAGQPPLLIDRVLCDTPAFASSMPAPIQTPVGSWLRQIYDSITMTGSQHETFEHTLHNALTICWGPPGSGKTYCNASMLCRMLVAALAAGTTCRVLVTAYTNKALELLLEKVRLPWSSLC